MSDFKDVYSAKTRIKRVPLSEDTKLMGWGTSFIFLHSTGCLGSGQVESAESVDVFSCHFDAILL